MKTKLPSANRPQTNKTNSAIICLINAKGLHIKPVQPQTLFSTQPDGPCHGWCVVAHSMPADSTNMYVAIVANDIGNNNMAYTDGGRAYCLTQC